MQFRFWYNKHHRFEEKGFQGHEDIMLCIWVCRWVHYDKKNGQSTSSQET